MLAEAAVVVAMLLLLKTLQRGYHQYQTYNIHPGPQHKIKVVET